MRNNNNVIINKLTTRSLSSDKRRNFFIVAAISLTTFMIASVLSIGISLYESINMNEKRMQGSVSHMAFVTPTEEQLDKIYTLDYVKTVGEGAYVAVAKDIPKLENSNIVYVSKTQWTEMFCPAFTNIEGHYPEKENEIMLSRYILDAMGINDPKIGMEIPISYVVNDGGEVRTEIFVLSCIYTEYAHSRQGGFTAIYTSYEFASRHGKTAIENIMVNVIFNDDRSAASVERNTERLKQDLEFSESQKYTLSPAFTGNYGSTTTYISLLSIIVFLMFTGYLLIYNVMYISVSKDVRFYGMLKTLGTTPRQIRRIVTGQVLRLCVVGLPIGCVVSAAVSLLIVPAIISNSGIDTGTVVSFSPIIYIGAILFAVLTAFIGTATSANKAAYISPVEALKFTECETHKQRVHTSAHGKPYKMALRNIFRNRKQAVVVMLSLFLSIVLFSSIMSIIFSIDVDNFVNTDYNYDISISSSYISSNYLDGDFVKSINEIEGVLEVATTTIETTEFVYSQPLDKYAEFISNKYSVPKEDVIANHLGFGIKGIDTLILKKINETLPIPVDADKFERGEIALINKVGGIEGAADCFADVSEFEIMCGAEKDIYHFANGGIVSLYGPPTGWGFSMSGLEILVSNNFLLKYFSELPILYAELNVVDGYDEQVLNAINNISSPNDIIIVSRLEARKEMQDSKLIMTVLGGGVSTILGFIGLFNFINVMSVGVSSRKREIATIESIGMSKKQMRLMLRCEGIGYAVITILCSLTLGNLITYSLFLLFKNVAGYAVFTYPFIPVFIMCAAILFICSITPDIAYKGISKMSLTERLREVE